MATQNYYTKDQAQLLNLDYGKIQQFAEYAADNEYYVKVLYEGQVWDCDKKAFIDPKEFCYEGSQINKWGKFVPCYWIKLNYSACDFMQQMCEDLNTLQRELDKERGN